MCHQVASIREVTRGSEGLSRDSRMAYEGWRPASIPTRFSHELRILSPKRGRSDGTRWRLRTGLVDQTATLHQSGDGQGERDEGDRPIQVRVTRRCPGTPRYRQASGQG